MTPANVYIISGLKIIMEDLKEKQLNIALFLTVIFGFILRVINAQTASVFGDPPHLVLQAKNFLDSGLLTIWDQSTFLWYAFTNIFYKIFGITQFASRFSSVLFGTLTILVIYLFVKEFSGNKRIALISSLIYAFAPTFIFNASDEHDICVLFFIIFTFYCLVKGLKRGKNSYLILSGVLFGLAAMWKAYVAILLVPYIGFMIYYAYTKRFALRKNSKILIWVAVIIGLMVSPTFIYDYSNYKHNELTTFMTAKFLVTPNQKINDLYGWAGGGDLNRRTSQFFQRLFISLQYGTPEQDSTPSVLYYALTQSLYSNGPILIVLSLVGISFMFIKRKKDKFAKDYLVFYLLYFFLPFLVLIDSNLLYKHYVHFFAFAIPFMAYLINHIYLYFREKFSFLREVVKKKECIYFLFGLLMLFEFFVVLSLPFNGNEFFFSPNPEGQFLKYKASSIPDDSLIIYDERIYNSLAGWIFNDRFYISAVNLNKFREFNAQSNFRQPVPVYIVECVPDQCGWATTPTLTDSMETFFDSVKNQSIPLVHTSKGKLNARQHSLKYYNPLFSKKESSDQFVVYKTTMDIDLNLAKQMKMQYSYFLYPTGYENKELPVFKNFIYVPEGSFEILINKFAWFMFYLEILVSFLVIPFLIIEYYLYK